MSAWDAAYYSLWLSSLGFLTTLILIAHDRMWLWYCLQNLLLGAYFVGLDGDLGRWLGLSVAQNEQLSLVLGVVFLTYCFVMLTGLIRNEHPLGRVKSVMLLFAALSLGLLPLSQVLSPDWFQVAMFTMLSVALISQLVPPLTWGFLPRMASQVWMPTMVAVAAGAAVYIGLRSMAVGLTDEQASQVRHLVILWGVMGGLITMFFMTRTIEQSRRQASAQALQAAQHETALVQELLAAERRVNGFEREIALRFDTSDELPERDEPEPADPEVLELFVLIDALSQMFGHEAQEKAIELRAVHSSAKVAVSSLVMMRVLANLLTHALEDPNCGKILLGCRIKGDSISLEVHNNGDGLSPEELARLNRYIDLGAAPADSGLGLEMVAELCAEAGLLWEPISVPGRGAIMRIRIPMVH